MRVMKDIDLSQLEQELKAAGVSIRGLGTTGNDPATDLQVLTYDEGGALVELPSEAAAVIAAHTPTPPPPEPNYGGDAVDIDKGAAAAVTQLRAFLALTPPTNAEIVANDKLQNRVLLAILRRLVS